jgi:hypothetical protein
VNCEHIRPLLSAYLDGELDAGEQAQVAAHLAHCQACARTLDEWRALGQEIRTLPDLPVPSGMRAEFSTRLHRRSPFSGPLMRPLVSVLSTVVFVIALAALAIGTSRTIRRMQTLDRAAEIVATFPANGATGVPLDANLTIIFARPMDRASVEAAIQTTPPVQLAFAWQKETLTAVPLTDWQPATQYTLVVASTAREAEGGMLETPFVLRFETEAALPTTTPTALPTATDTALAATSPTAPPTASPTPSPTTAPIESPTQPPVASPTTPPTPSPTLSPSPSPTGALTPIGRFGYLWRTELGGPGGPLGLATAEEQELWNAVQPFERGRMIWLDQLHEDQIYVLTYGQDENQGTWQQYVDTYREGEPESAGLTPPEGLLEPVRGFGRLWREELGGPEALVGWALAPEEGYTGAVQPFVHGLMLWNPLSDAIYVLWDDSTWKAYPAAS